ncbi:MAG: hypothetical protein PVJ27_10595 [Candidatus Brocadiaceae bacterium]
MRRIALLGLMCVLALSLLGCAEYLTPVRPPGGALITVISAPLSVDFKDTPVCSKQGSASTFYFHDPLFTGMDFAWDRAGLKEAATDGELTAVEYADYTYLRILGIFGKFTVTAYGR